jgi:AhpD family alkylhydroperoxidase
MSAGHRHLEDFRRERERQNDKLLETKHKGIQRFFALDHQAYAEGTALPAKTKELLGLAASLVLRCDDCITYHVVRSVEEGVTREEMLDVFNVALVVGGSITIPHVRRAMDRLDEALEQAADDGGASS